MQGSKFMMQKGESSSSGSEDESDKSSESEEDQKKFTRFNFESSSDSDTEEHRKVRPMKDKRMDAFRNVLKEIGNHIKINDFSALIDDFVSLNKELDKSKQLVEKEGVPKLYFKGLVLIEDAVNDVNKKSLSSMQTKSWNSLRNKVKKHDKDYEDKLKEYRENPIKSEDEAEKSDKESDEEKKAKRKPKKKRAESGEEGSSDEDKEKSDEDESSSESEEETQDRSKMTPEERRKKVCFLPG